jgi:heat shock protein HtpX
MRSRVGHRGANRDAISASSRHLTHNPAGSGHGCGDLPLNSGAAFVLRSPGDTPQGLRPVNSADFEERQLANIVGEMAIAGRVPEPRVLLLDGEFINAGAARGDPWTVFVSRGLLDHLDRDETKGVLAHLLAAIANGNLRIASGVLTVLQTFG